MNSKLRDKINQENIKRVINRMLKNCDSDIYGVKHGKSIVIW